MGFLRTLQQICGAAMSAIYSVNALIKTLFGGK